MGSYSRCRRFAVVVVPSLLVASGCTTPGARDVLSLPATAFTTLTNICYRAQDPPAFTVTTKTNTLLPLIGIVEAVARGNAVRAENDLEDPAVGLSRDLAAQVAVAHRIEASDCADSEPSDPVAELTVATTQWSIGFFPAQPAKYGLTYRVRVSLTEPRERQVIASGRCVYVTPIASAPGYEEMLSSHAARLQQELRSAREMCLTSLATAIL